MPYLIYLRKSRADKEAESRGEGETLARHEALLTQLADRQKLPIGAIYKEIVSGETIASRPQMQKLLIEVMQGLWEGVLVMEVERLARGDTKDQGTVAEAFKFSRTKIITPVKTFDPDNEFDEEYFEFNLFMSRREYKTINRRIQQGRLAAFEDGWYIAGLAPYGYKKVKHKGDKGWSLEIIEHEAAIVRLIFHLYTVGVPQEDGSYLRLGSHKISERLNALHIPSRTGGNFSASSVMDIIRNPVYTGVMRWQWRKVKKKMEHGRIIVSRPKNDDCKTIKGRFPYIISVEQYELATQIRTRKFSTHPNADNSLKNPLSGLIYCAKCGRAMTRARSRTKENYPILRCPNSKCDNISAPLCQIEEGLLSGLEKWASGYRLDWDETDKIKSEGSQFSILSITGSELKRQLEQTDWQLERAYEFLEQGIYSVELFKTRIEKLNVQKKEIEIRLDQQIAEMESQGNGKKIYRTPIRFPTSLIGAYRCMEDAPAKNCLLRSIVQRVEYIKKEKNSKGQAGRAAFELTLYPKIPKHTMEMPANIDPRPDGSYV